MQAPATNQGGKGEGMAEQNGTWLPTAYLMVIFYLFMRCDKALF